VGFYVRCDLEYDVVTSPNSYVDKIFESLTLHITDKSCNKHVQYLVTSIYRSPTPIQNVSHADQIGRFFDNFETLTNFLQSKNLTSFICMDSNINLLDLNNVTAMSFFNNILDHGYAPVNFKATRMTNNSASLIDQILCNNPIKCTVSGSIIDDLSDHWITFVQLIQNNKHKMKPKVDKRRLITTENLTNFRNSLSNLHWNEVLLSDNVDVCYDLFWNQLKTLYDLHFPVVTSRFNRNFNKISDFMTKGLLVSRRTKINLLKRSLTEPTEQNKLKYREFRNLYNKLLRIRKKSHLQERLNKCKKNPKKRGKF
jgi:hypothetical protein